MEHIDKEVYFNVYCPMCVDEKTSEADEPCFSCLENESNEQSHVPTKFKPKDKEKYELYLKTLKENQGNKECCCKCQNPM